MSSRAHNNPACATWANECHIRRSHTRFFVQKGLRPVAYRGQLRRRPQFKMIDEVPDLDDAKFDKGESLGPPPTKVADIHACALTVGLVHVLSRFIGLS